MFTNTTADREHHTTHQDGARIADQAERHASALGELIDSRYLNANGKAVAHGTRGLIYAILALRETITATAGDTTDAITDLDTTLGIIAGAVTDSVTGEADDLPAGRTA